MLLLIFHLYIATYSILLRKYVVVTFVSNWFTSIIAINVQMIHKGICSFQCNSLSLLIYTIMILISNEINWFISIEWNILKLFLIDDFLQVYPFEYLNLLTIICFVALSNVKIFWKIFSLFLRLHCYVIILFPYIYFLNLNKQQII